MEPTAQFVKRAEYARMRGWHRSYVTKLEKENRIVLSEDGKLVNVEKTNALVGQTSDPSKAGVQERWADERRDRDVYAPGNGFILGAASSAAPTPPSAPATHAAPAAPANSSLSGSTAEEQSFHSARASREHFAGQLVKLEFEWVSGLLVSKLRVEDAAHLVGRSVRDRVLGAIPRISPELAAITDPWELEKRLMAEMRKALDDLASYFGSVMADIENDPARGNLRDLAKQGRERYGTDKGDND